MIDYKPHRGYTGRCKGVLEFIRDTVIGMAADAATPWYAIIANKTKYGEISKDTPDVDALP